MKFYGYRCTTASTWSSCRSRWMVHERMMHCAGSNDPTFCYQSGAPGHIMHCAHMSKPHERIPKSLPFEGGFRHRGNISWPEEARPPISIRISNLPCELPTFRLTAGGSITSLLGQKHADRFATGSDWTSSDNASNVFVPHTAAHS